MHITYCEIHLTYTPLSSSYRDRAMRKSIINLDYLITSTGQCAYFITSVDTLPGNNFLKRVLPLLPMTIKSIFSDSAYSTMMAAAGFAPPTISALRS
jgi:hypothetical protein